MVLDAVRDGYTSEQIAAQVRGLSGRQVSTCLYALVADGLLIRRMVGEGSHVYYTNGMRLANARINALWRKPRRGKK